MKRRILRPDTRGQKFLQDALVQLKEFQHDSIERLTRVEESLRLLRQDLIGNGQPGRILRLEADTDQFRAEYHRQRGVLAGISFVISIAIGLLARYFDF